MRVRGPPARSGAWLAADQSAAVGLFLQSLPGETGNDEGWRRVCRLADTVKTEEMLRLLPLEVLRRLFHEDDLRLFDLAPVAFRCGCSRERIEDALRGMGRDEVDAIVRERGSVEADCEFFNAHFRFDAVDVAALFADVAPADLPDPQH